VHGETRHLRAACPDTPGSGPPHVHAGPDRTGSEPAGGVQIVACLGLLGERVDIGLGQLVPASGDGRDPGCAWVTRDLAPRSPLLRADRELRAGSPLKIVAAPRRHSSSYRFDNPNDNVKNATCP